VPVHGTLHHLVRHAELARELQVPEVCVLENGDVGELDDAGTLAKVGRVHGGRVHVFAGREVPASVLAERSSLAERGALHVTVPVDAGGHIAGPSCAIVPRGARSDARPGPCDAGARRGARSARATLADRVTTTSPRPCGEPFAAPWGAFWASEPVTLVTVLRVAS
jgi:ribonuclease J